MTHTEENSNQDRESKLKERKQKEEKTLIFLSCLVSSLGWKLKLSSQFCSLFLTLLIFFVKLGYCFLSSFLWNQTRESYFPFPLSQYQTANTEKCLHFPRILVLRALLFFSSKNPAMMPPSGLRHPCPPFSLDRWISIF